MDAELYKATSSGDFPKFVSLITTNPGFLFQTTAQKNTVLHIAVEFNKKKIVEEILRQPLSILGITNSKKDTALHIAARFGHFEVAEELIECAKRHGFEEENELLGMRNMDRETALHDAVKNRHCSVVKLLIEECPGLAGCVNGDGESPLFVAVEKGFLEIAHEILQVDLSCSFKGREGANALHALILRTQKRYTQSLYEFPLRVYLAFPIMFINRFLPELLNLPYWERRTTRNLTQRQKDFWVELLEKNPQLRREADDYGWLPLHYAANLGSAELVELILRDEASLAYEKDKMGVSALHLAAKGGRVGAVKMFIKYCPDSCEMLDCKERTALHVAVENGQNYGVKKMLEIPHFVNLVNQQDNEGNTALHLAAFSGNYVTLMTLAVHPRVNYKIANKKGLNTNDIIRLSSKFRWYEKTFSIAHLEYNGALQGMQRVFTRNPTTEMEKTHEESHKREETTENSQQAMAAKPVSEAQTSKIWSEFSDANLVVATIIATITFSAVFQVPGGYDPQNGRAVLRNQKYFRLYLITDSLSFGYAAASMFVTFLAGLFGTGSGFSYPRRWVTFLTGISLWFLVLCFMFGTSAVMAEDSGFAMLVRAIACVSFTWPVFLLGALGVNWFAYFP